MTPVAPRRRSLCAFVTIVAAAACGPRVLDDAPTIAGERFATEVCEAASACACGTPFDGPDECERVVAARFDAAAKDLTLDEACLDAWVDDDRLGTCEALDTFLTAPPCAILRGDRSAGQACSPHRNVPAPAGVVTDCAEGLSCLVGRCVELGEPIGGLLGAGQPCDPTIPGICNTLDGLYCASSGVCEPGVGLGEACDSVFACVGGETAATCEYDGALPGVCVATRPLGAACDPAQYRPCASVQQEGSAGSVASCDPITRQCVAGPGPAACVAFRDPLAAPS